MNAANMPVPRGAPLVRKDGGAFVSRGASNPPPQKLSISIQPDHAHMIPRVTGDTDLAVA